MKDKVPTRYPGVFRLDQATYWIRAKVVDPRTGKNKEIDRVLDGVTAHEAAQKRDDLINDVKQAVQQARRVRVGEFAKSWIESKALKLDSTTLRTYADALENHILPALGDYYYDALSPTDVQRWIDDALLRGWTSEKRGSKRSKTKTVRRSYSRDTVRGWFRVFRTMTRDAMAALELQRDPTLRITMPEESCEEDEVNSLSPTQLAAFLTAMRTHYPQHYALVVLLAYTGLRFCHASALHWDDWEEARGVLRVSRKQVRGKLGSVTRKKRAPKEYPVEPELAAILKEHRMHLLKDQAPGLANGLMFPSTVGTYRTPNSLDAAWAKCLTAAQIGKRFTIHGLRYTFTDLVRLANVDAVVRRALTGHVTEEMQRHYSTVGLEEKRAAVAGVLRLVPPEAREGADAHVVHRGRCGRRAQRAGRDRLVHRERRDRLVHRERRDRLVHRERRDRFVHRERRDRLVHRERRERAHCERRDRLTHRGRLADRARGEPHVACRARREPHLAHPKWGSRWGFGIREEIGPLRGGLNGPSSL